MSFDIVSIVVHGLTLEVEIGIEAGYLLLKIKLPLLLLVLLLLVKQNQRSENIPKRVVPETLLTITITIIFFLVFSSPLFRVVVHTQLVHFGEQAIKMGEIVLVKKWV
ncbi:hypothetical protein PanWU01x14_305330 [Parasponia andersonii]|uniref:Uncharacterized protein n=1 Tax=Parasponia andersonii TaxID=3476 RepID=A0A2P5ASG1_PARAD|nr:hypothetical protein PanWU01x14_305330 [Parasponia andersonii]